MAVSLKDHKDTQVSATTFIHTLVYTYEVQEGITAHCQSPHRHHGRQGLCSTDGAPPSNQFVHAETVVRQSQHSIEEPHQLSAVSSFGLSVLGAQSTWEGELSHTARPLLSGERVPLARRGACREKVSKC
jgi:hypothetical protein